MSEALDANLLGAWRMTQALLPLLRASPHGRVVNVSSGAGSITTMTGAGPPAYSVSKAALNALTRLLAADLRPILVNAVCPGWVATDMGGPAAARSPRAPPGSCGRRRSPTTARPAASSATDARSPGSD